MACSRCSVTRPAGGARKKRHLGGALLVISIVGNVVREGADLYGNVL